VLRERPEAPEAVRDMLTRRLVDIDAETWSAVLTSLTNYLGMDPAYLMTWVVQDVDNRIGELERLAPPEVSSFVRTLLAWHQPELQSAYAHWRENPNDWRTMFREVFLDHVTGRFLIKVRVVKYNGEEVVFEGPPDSFLNMTRNLLITLRGVGSPEVFTPGYVGQFVQEASGFFELLGAGQAEPAATEAPPGEPPGPPPGGAAGGPSPEPADVPGSAPDA
jgi:hypothetical protein